MNRIHHFLTRLKLCSQRLNTKRPRWEVLTRRAEMGRSHVPSGDGTFLRAEARWDVPTRRAEMGRSYAPSGDTTFLLPPDDLDLSKAECEQF